VKVWCNKHTVMVLSPAGHRVPKPVAEVLPWHALMTVLLWVFVRRRMDITQPVQALAWLLADFAEFDWETYVGGGPPRRRRPGLCGVPLPPPPSEVAVLAGCGAGGFPAHMACEVSRVRSDLHFPPPSTHTCTAFALACLACRNALSLFGAVRVSDLAAGTAVLSPVDSGLLDVAGSLGPGAVIPSRRVCQPLGGPLCSCAVWVVDDESMRFACVSQRWCKWWLCTLCCMLFVPLCLPRGR
jgi:hypothetical protein